MSEWLIIHKYQNSFPLWKLKKQKSNKILEFGKPFISWGIFLGGVYFPGLLWGVFSVGEGEEGNFHGGYWQSYILAYWKGGKDWVKFSKMGANSITGFDLK